MYIKKIIEYKIYKQFLKTIADNISELEVYTEQVEQIRQDSKKLMFNIIINNVKPIGI